MHHVVIYSLPRLRTGHLDSRFEAEEGHTAGPGLAAACGGAAFDREGRVVEVKEGSREGAFGGALLGASAFVSRMQSRLALMRDVSQKSLHSMK